MYTAAASPAVVRYARTSRFLPIPVTEWTAPMDTAAQSALEHQQGRRLDRRVVSPARPLQCPGPAT